MKAPHIVCCTLFRNPAHYLGMHTIKEGTLNAVDIVPVCWTSRWNGIARSPLQIFLLLPTVFSFVQLEKFHSREHEIKGTKHRRKDTFVRIANWGSIELREEYGHHEYY